MATPADARPIPILDLAGPAIACSLDDARMQGRLADWDALLSRARARTSLGDGLRVELGAAEDLGAVARLAAAEQDCCRFFAFSLTIDERGPALEVRWPPEAGPGVRGMFPA